MQDAAAPVTQANASAAELAQWNTGQGGGSTNTDTMMVLQAQRCRLPHGHLPPAELRRGLLQCLGDPAAQP